MSTKSQDRRVRWLDRKFKEQSPAQTADIMMAPGDTFYATVTVCVRFMLCYKYNLMITLIQAFPQHMMSIN